MVAEVEIIIEFFGNGLPFTADIETPCIALSKILPFSRISSIRNQDISLVFQNCLLFLDGVYPFRVLKISANLYFGTSLSKFNMLFL